MARITIRRVIAAGGATVATLLLVGCSAGSTAGDAVPAEPPAVAAPEQAGPDQAAPERAETGQGTGGSTGGSGGSEDAAVVSADRALVVTATTTVRAGDVAAATGQALALAAKHDALVVGQRTTTGADPGPEPLPDDTGSASSVITMRVSPDTLDALLADVATLGVVVSVTRDVADVTTQVADVDARVRTAQASLARVRALLSRAEDLGDVVALEAELSTRQAALESLQAQQRALADATARATLTLTLVDEAAPEPDDPQVGFLAGLERGWTAFTGALAVGLTVLGAALPFLVVLAVVVGGTVLLVRWTGRSRRPTDAPGPGA